MADGPSEHTTYAIDPGVDRCACQARANHLIAHGPQCLRPETSGEYPPMNSFYRPNRILHISEFLGGRAIERPIVPLGIVEVLGEKLVNAQLGRFGRRRKTLGRRWALRRQSTFPLVPVGKNAVVLSPALVGSVSAKANVVAIDSHEAQVAGLVVPIPRVWFFSLRHGRVSRVRYMHAIENR